MRSVIAAVAAVLALVILAGSAFIYSGIYYVGADQPHWSTTAWLLYQARDRSIRAHASGIAVPAGLDDPARIAAGVTHYAEHCAVCHGAPGVERGEIAEGLYPKPPDLAVTSKGYTDAELFWIVKHGIEMTGMPSWGGHSDDELWATVGFIRKLPGMTPEDYAKLFEASRARSGHQQENQQQQPGPALEPAEKNHEQPAGPGIARQPDGPGHDHPAGHRH
jgi:mono/diheme cytochrome c family protein